MLYCLFIFIESELCFEPIVNNNLTHNEYLEHQILYCNASTRALNNYSCNISMKTSHTSAGRILKTFYGFFPRNLSVVFMKLNGNSTMLTSTRTSDLGKKYWELHVKTHVGTVVWCMNTEISSIFGVSSFRSLSDVIG